MSETIQSVDKKFQELDEKYKAVPKRKWVFRFATLAFLVLTVLLSFVLGVVKDYGVKRAYTNYLETEDPAVLNDYFDNDAIRGNAEAMDRLEEFTIGIDNNIALAGLSWTSDTNKDYMNKIGDVTAWRDVDTGKLVININGEKKELGDVSVGEIIAKQDIVYYKSEADEVLYRYPLTGDRPIAVLADPIQSFAIIGDQIFVLTKAGVIVRYSIEDKSVEEVVTNVQRFYIAGTLIVQNGTKVYTIGLDGSDKTELIDNALLVGADSKNVYVTDFGSADKKIIDSIGNSIQSNGTYILYSFNMETRTIEAIDSSDDFIRAVYSTENGIVMDTLVDAVKENADED